MANEVIAAIRPESRLGDTLLKWNHVSRVLAATPRRKPRKQSLS
jgi:hypothetical protein